MVTRILINFYTYLFGIVFIVGFPLCIVADVVFHMD